jgi:hypothetical protein
LCSRFSLPRESKQPPTPEAVKVYQEAVNDITSHIHSDAAYAIEMNEQLDSYNTGW